MSKNISLDVLTDYNTVIETLTKLREEYGGDSMVELEIEYDPEDNCCDAPMATLVVPDKNVRK